MEWYKANCQCGYFGKTVIVKVDKRLALQPKAQAGICYKHGVTFLVSYESFIIGYNPDTKQLVMPTKEYGIHPAWTASPDYSKTTARHVNSFCKEVCPQFNYYDCKKFWHGNLIEVL